MKNFSFAYYFFFYFYFYGKKWDGVLCSKVKNKDILNDLKSRPKRRDFFIPYGWYENERTIFLLLLFLLYANHKVGCRYA